jgi:general secretion pathway protein L
VGKGVRARIVLPRRMVLLREFEAPAMGMSDVRRMVTHDIDRLTPFRPENVCFDVAQLSVDESGRQKILLGVLPRKYANEVLARAEAEGIEPVEMKIAGDAGQEVPGLDFLPTAQRSERGSARHILYWWGGVGALAAANILLLVARDVSDLDTLQQTVDAQATSVTIAQRVGDRVETESARRGALVQMRKMGSPLRVMNAATQVLPRSTWVQRLEWNGKTVRLAGFKDARFDVLAAMEAAPLFRNARAVAIQTPAKAGTTPFDVSADENAKGAK